MIRVINETELDDLDNLIPAYIAHKEEPDLTVETVKRQMYSGVTKASHQILCSYDSKGIANGFLTHAMESNRFPIIFANWDFSIEKELFDFTFKTQSENAHTLIFESGYPTPWISDELSQYAVSLGFVKRDRGYMRLEPIHSDSLPVFNDEFSLDTFEDSVVDEVSKLVFKCVVDTVDQDLFPNVYASVDLIKQFLNDLLNGNFGTHKSNYSWILYENEIPIGACFMITRDSTGFVMHIVIDPDYRQRGLGKLLLIHSIGSLQKTEKKLSKIELAVTLDNPALIMYRSLGFKIVSKSSNYVWKKS